ncbi:MAG: UDP-N-acetylglucosamine 2-epimerase [Rubinisphaera brasiliensis]|uniref:UDP-N-acetylglucosamine 2-epimerase n=1 Tax=Rubinisphaera brasiliensis TaxID=119 RepID=UPI00391A05E1
MKKLLFLSGTRADFGKVEPLARAAQDSGYDVTFFVTGMHMLEKYGLTKVEVHRTFPKVAEFVNQRQGDTMDTILSKTILGFSDYVMEAKPDAVFVHGDRVEAFAGAIVCATNYIPCVHIEGGEVSGTIDEMFRHCNTKLSSSHLVSSDSAKHRVMALGESEDQIHVIGSPELDVHLQPSGVTLDEVRDRYQITFEDYGICIFHPVTSEVESMGQQARDLFRSLEQSGREFVIVAPNNDPGSEAIFEAIDKLPKERFRVLPSMRFRHFSELMKNASAFVGNSSAGVREVPFLGIPSLNIGTRQTNRALSEEMQNCLAEDDEAIQAFLRDVWGKRLPRHSGFGSGRATERFMALLNSGAFWNSPLQKNFVDIAGFFQRAA